MSPREVADDWQQACSELKQRGARLLRSRLWADCAFLVGAAQQRVRAHRLLLGIASPVFERMFYGALPPGAEPVRVPDVHPDAFTALLEYIYTDDIKITSVGHCCDLYYAAHKYMLPHLVQVCSAYLSCNLGAADACRCYELAYLFDDKRLLNKTLKVISSDTKDVLKADSFLEAELSTVVTVFKQETLKIDSEIDLFRAAKRYKRSMDSKSVEPPSGLQPGDKLKSLKLELETSCTQEQSETGIEESLADGSSEGTIDPGCSNKDSNRSLPESKPDCSKSSQPGMATIRSAVEQIRFLTLTPQQFAEGPARSALLTQQESFAIFMNMSSKFTETPMPSCLSTSRKSRNQHNDYGIKEATIRLVVSSFNGRNEAVMSDTVIVQSLPWRIEMKPGRESDENRQVGLYLTCDGVEGMNWSCVVESKFRVLCIRPVMNLSRAVEMIFFSGGNSRGYQNFIPWRSVVDRANGYIRHGTVTFEAHVVVKKVQGVPVSSSLQ